jgi:hypothetical protein
MAVPAFCRYCGYQNTPDDLFCANCGKPTGEQPATFISHSTPPPQQPQQVHVHVTQQNVNNSGCGCGSCMWWIIGFLILSAIIGGGSNK